MKRFFFSLALVLMSASLQAQEYYGRVSDPDGYTNIRRGPSLKDAIVRTYRSGDYLYYTPLSNGWSKVYSGNKSSTFMGYMSTSRIKRTNPMTGKSVSESSVKLRDMIVNDPDGYVNVRQQPSAKSKIVGKLMDGVHVLAGKRQGNWTEVWDSMNLKKSMGWVYSNRLTY